MKKLVAMLMMFALIGASALAEITVQVAKVGGEECYVGIRTSHVALTLDMDTWKYKTAEGLVWQAEPIHFGTMDEMLMPRSEDEIHRMNGLYAALEDASGFWEKPVKGTGRLTVYSAPDETSLRGANGKAAVELSGGVKLMMTLGDWSLIEYEVSAGANRIGWVQKTTLGSAPVMFTDIPVTLKEDAVLTDDPRGTQRAVSRAGELTDVHLLARLDAFWGYVSAKTADGQAVWGFVPLRYIEMQESINREMMAELAGDWGFCGGGELLGEVFTLTAEGEITFWQLSEEVLMSQSYLTEGLKERVLSSQADWAVVTGTNGHAWDIVLTGEDGRRERYHIYDRDDGLLSLTQCEAGGSWQRLPK